MQKLSVFVPILFKGLRFILEALIFTAPVLYFCSIEAIIITSFGQMVTKIVLEAMVFAKTIVNKIFVSTFNFQGKLLQ